MSDPYAILGLKRDAAPDEIKSAFRSLAKRHHPDADEAHPETFKQVAMAYAVLSDPEKKTRFDKGEIAWDGSPAPSRKPRRAPPRKTGPAKRPPAAKLRTDDMARRAEAYRRRLGDMAENGDAPKPEDLIRADPEGVHVAPVTLEEAAVGATRHLLLNGGEVLELKIPPGVRDRQRIRVKVGHGVRDADVEVRVAPHSLFRRVGADLHVDVAITLYDAALGAKIETPTLTGPVAVTLPPRFDGSRTLRLKGKGLPDKDGEKGDLFVRPRVVLPEAEGKAAAALVKFAKKWAAKEPYDAPERAGRAAPPADEDA